MSKSKFEYKVVQVSKNESIDAIVKGLNALGSEGWELVDVEHAVMHMTAIFKKES